MENDNAWTRFRQEALLEDEVKTEYRIGGQETQAQLEATPLNLTGEPSQKRRGIDWSFSKFFDLGANKLMGSSMFCVNTQVLMVLLRDSAYGGRYFGTTGSIARELRTDPESIRKRIKAMEGEGLLVRVESNEGSGYIQLNPHYFIAGGREDEDIANRVWARESARRLREQSKKDKQGRQPRP